ncbi:MAG: preprotein translocase subunit SecY [Rickettsiaceae bacterium]
MKISNTKSLSDKILFTIVILIIYRIGSFIPISGIDSLSLSKVASQNSSGVLGMVDILSGGSLNRMSIFALSIMPYITASIIMQLLSMAFKSLENLKKDGESGRGKINQISRYLTVLLAGFQAYGVAVGLESFTSSAGPVVLSPGMVFKFTTILTLVVGTILLMWLGEQITTNGISNGISLIIFISIISSMPSAIINMFELSRKGVLSYFVSFAICCGAILLIALITFFEQASRKILVQYPKRQVGNKLYSGESTYIPLKINTSGVIPPIFASSILLFPLTISSFSGNSPILGWFAYYLGHGKPAYIIIYVALILFFSFFYTAVVFNSNDTANNLRKYGAYIPGIRPGLNTASYFDYVLTRITVIGGIYLSVVCIVPEIVMNKYSISFSLSGTSFLIMVNVALETFNQIQVQLFSAKYDHLMKKFKK